MNAGQTLLLLHMLEHDAMNIYMKWTLQCASFFTFNQQSSHLELTYLSSHNIYLAHVLYFLCFVLACHIQR